MRDPLSPVLARLIEEVRREKEEEKGEGTPTAAYNRAHNRHMKPSPGGRHNRAYTRHNRS